MKLILAAVLGLAIAGSASAQTLGDQIKTTLLDNVQTTTLFTDDGETHVALLDAVIQAVLVNNEYLVNGEFGFSADTGPDAQTEPISHYIAGISVRLDPLLGLLNVNIPEHWEFLKAIQHGPSIHYNFRETTPSDDSKWILGYKVGLAFSLEPKK